MKRDIPGIIRDFEKKNEATDIIWKKDKLQKLSQIMIDFPKQNISKIILSQ